MPIEESFDLFSDALPSASRVGTRGKVSSTDKTASNLWSIWEEVSERPKSKMPARFVRGVRKARDMKVSEANLERRVRSAVYLRPHARDPEDIGRVVSAMTVQKSVRSAEMLSMSKGSEKFLWATDDDWEALTDLSYLEDKLGTTRDRWTNGDLEYAAIITSTMTEEMVDRAVERVSIHVGDSELTPKEIVLNSRLWREGAAPVKANAKRGRDAYAAGAKASADLRNVNIDLDEQAERLALQGCPPKKIAKFHLLAPEGYWESVEMVVDASGCSLQEAYNRLSELFDGWNPKKRETPKW